VLAERIIITIYSRGLFDTENSSRRSDLRILPGVRRFKDSSRKSFEKSSKSLPENLLR